MYNVKPQASYRLTTRTNETKPSCKTRLQNQAPLFKQYSQQKFVCKYSSKTTKIHFFYENNSHWAENLLANPMIALQWEHKSMMNNIRPSLVSRHHKLYVFGE